MPVQITSDNLEVTSSMQELVYSKLSKILNKLSHPEDEIDIRVVLNKGSAEDTFESKVELKVKEGFFVGKDFEYTLESSLVRAIDDTLDQFIKNKDRAETKEWQQRRDQKHDRLFI